MTWIELEGAVNVRDLGGLPTTDGGTTVPGRLLRSENLQELSPGDVTKLVDEIGLTTVVDLRSTNEVAIERLARSKMYAGGVSGVPVRAHTPRTETMKAFLEQLGTRYGGVEAWLAANGFTAEELGQLRAKLRQE